MANWNLTSEVPPLARDLRSNYPPRSGWESIGDGGTDGRSGDLYPEITRARDNNQVVELNPGGSYDISGGIQFDSGVSLAGLVCDPSNPATIYYSGTAEEYLFEFHGVDTFVLEGVTINITEGVDTDIGLAYGRVGTEFWSKGVTLTGQRDRQNGTAGGRYTFAPRIEDPAGTGYVEDLSLMDGDVQRLDAPNGFHDHAQGVNTDEPHHRGTIVYWGCEISGWNDNGYYMANAPDGRAIMVDCYGADCRGGIFRMGRNDEVVGGTAEQYAGPVGWDNGDGPGHCLSAYYGPPKRIVGLTCRGNQYGNAMLVARKDDNGTPSTTLDRCVVHVDGDNASPLMRLQSGAEWELVDCHFLDESTTPREYSPSALLTQGSSITSDSTWHFDAPSYNEVYLKSGTSLTHEGTTYTGPRPLTAGDLGIPAATTPLPQPHFDDGTGDLDDRLVITRNSATQELEPGVEVWVRPL